MLRIEKKLHHGTRTEHRPHTRLHRPRGVNRVDYSSKSGRLRLAVMPNRKQLKQEAEEILDKLAITPEDREGDMIDMAIGFLHAFKKIDKNKKGSLSRDDFHDVLQCLNPEESPDKFLALCDFNHDGVVSKEEFIRAYVKLEITDKHYATFAEIDENVDGKISIEELQKAFAGSKYTTEKVEKWFKKADLNKSGFISYREFSKSPLQNKYKKAKRRREKEARKAEAANAETVEAEADKNEAEN